MIILEERGDNFFNVLSLNYFVCVLRCVAYPCELLLEMFYEVGGQEGLETGPEHHQLGEEEQEQAYVSRHC